MLEEDLDRLERALAESPEDRESWLALARLAGRIGELPGWLHPVRHGPVLGSLISADEETVPLLDLFLPLLRLATYAHGDRDPETGMPREVTRTRDGARMLLVPGGHVEGLGDDAENEMVMLDPFADPVPTEADLGPYWIDVAPVSNAALARWLEETGESMPIPWEPKPREIATVPSHTPADYARWAGARVPSEAQWEHARREGRLTVPGDLITGERLAEWTSTESSPEPTPGSAAMTWVVTRGPGDRDRAEIPAHDGEDIAFRLALSVPGRPG